MTVIHPDQFLGLAGVGEAEADAILVPLPFERTVSYGTGTWRAPRAILDASCQIEFFDEETGVDFEERPRLHTLPALLDDADVESYLQLVRERVAGLRGKFVLGLGGEHSVTYGLVMGLAASPRELTIVHIDAHADLIDALDGRRWSHGTVMRRLWEAGCQLIQVGIRSLSREEYALIARKERITTVFAHEMQRRWRALLARLRQLRGPLYLSVDVDGLDPAVIPHTGTPQPNGLSWGQAMDVVRAVTEAPRAHLIGADVVELVASPHPPGCDLVAARLVMKILAFWWRGRRHRSGARLAKE